jgi:lambda repressor-like predicted transcriptional regulator
MIQLSRTRSKITLGGSAPNRALLIAAFIAININVIWGSTYLAIRYAVETISPLITAATRHLVAGSVLYTWA